MWKKKEAFWPKYFGGRLKFVGNLRQLYSGIAFLTRENNSLYVNFIFFSPAAAYKLYEFIQIYTHKMVVFYA